MSSIEDILKLNEDDFLNKLKSIQKEYHYDDSSYTDEEFDYLVDFYENKFNTKFEDIGSSPETKIKLPYPIPSQNKIKGKNAEEDLTKWINKQNDSLNQNYIVEEKIDGVSLFYISNSEGKKLYTRGDGEYGEDKTYLLEFLKFPEVDYDIIIRGELALRNDIFEEYVKEQKDKGNKNKLKKSRNIVTGVVNSLETSFDEDLLSKLTFYAFQLFTDEDLTHSQQLRQLKKMGFTVPYNKKFTRDELTVTNLENLLKERKCIPLDLNLNEFAENDDNDSPEIKCVKSEVDIDGLIITVNEVQHLPEENKNPTNAISFKLDTTKVAIVENIIWNIKSKDGYITPVVYINPLELLGSDIHKLSGHNAKFIISKKIGKGAKLLMTLGGDIIPTILNVIKKSRSKDLIYPDLEDDEYSWNDNEVKFVLNNPGTNPFVRKARIKYFSEHLKIEGLGPATINTLFDSGYDSLDKIFRMKANEISNLDRLAETSALSLCLNIKSSLTNVMLNKIMTATCIFGEGLAEGRIGSILTGLEIDTFEKLKEFNELDEDDKIQQLQTIQGIKKLAYQFSENLNEFIEWFDNNKEVITLYKKAEKKIGKYTNKIIVMSDLKDKKSWANKLESLGATIETNVTKRTNLLIVGSSEETDKVKKAKKYAIEIIHINNLKL